jgi:pimeloyl-ACP methyl ester carboxylesterase
MSLSAFSTLPQGVLTAPVPFTIAVPPAQQNEFTKLVRQAAIGVPTYYNTHTDTTNNTSYGLSRDWLAHAQDVLTSPREYSWREEQKRLNRYPHFRINVTTSIAPPSSSSSTGGGGGGGGDDTKETFDLHFTGLFSRNATATPVLLMHGWPGSWFEFAPMLDLLAAKYTPDTLPYHIVVPSLPDYGLSTRRGELARELSREGAAAAMDGLMGALGFGGGYVVQGGDVGSIVAQALCGLFEGCKALHCEYFLTNKGGGGGGMGKY